MPGSITPLPIMLDEEDRKVYEQLEPPKTIVVRYGYQKLVAELPYDGSDKPGCGSKLVIRTQRGIELAEMLTTTCPNSGCAKAVSRKEMLQFIENSGGKDFPFTDQGKVLRVATIDDVTEQRRLDGRMAELIRLCKGFIIELDLPMRLVEVELLLGGERIVFYYTAEQWVDFRTLVKKLAAELQTRIEMHQVNAREEARLVADYEKCGQHCCCKQFLKVLKPVSMRSAKVQKATLDPQKISGRCGRLMCCLRYEDQTYTELKKRLPNRKATVETTDGIGIVMDSQILTQLVLVRIGEQMPAAYPVEDIRVLTDTEVADFRKQELERQAEREERAARAYKAPPRKPRPRVDQPAAADTETSPAPEGGQQPGKRRRRRRGKREEPADQARRPDAAASPPADAAQDSTQASQPDGESAPRKRRRRRRRRRRGGGDQGTSGGDSPGGGSP